MDDDWSSCDEDIMMGMAEIDKALEQTNAHIFCNDETEVETECENICKMETENICKDETDNICKQKTENICKDETDNICKQKTDNICKDETDNICKDETDNICKQKTENICKDETDNICKQKTENICKQKTENICKDETENICKQKTENICKQKTENICKDETDNICKQKTENICKQKTENICKQKTENICKDETDNICKQKTENICKETTDEIEQRKGTNIKTQEEKDVFETTIDVEAVNNEHDYASTTQKTVVTEDNSDSEDDISLADLRQKVKSKIIVHETNNVMEVVPMQDEMTTLQVEADNILNSNLEVLLPLFCDYLQELPVNNEIIIDTETVFDSDTFGIETVGSADQVSDNIIDFDLLGDTDSVLGTGQDTEAGIEEQPNSEDGSSKRLSRRKSKDPDNWKSTIRKRLRNSGEEYTSSSGRLVQRKRLKRPNCKCKFNCSTNLTEADQEDIFVNYWKSNYGRQRDYIVSCVKVIHKKRSTTGKESRRKYTYEYFLPNQAKTNFFQVCRGFFLSTLSIGEKTLTYTLGRSDKVRCEDARGRHHNASTSIPNEAKQYIIQHIASFPVIDSHYCRENSKRKYLNSDLSIRKMYEIYKEKCDQDGKEPQKFWLYDNIFSHEFNYGFHKPKKDICLMCDSYSKLNPREQAEKKQLFDEHLERKKDARELKAADKTRAVNDKNVLAINFDLQKVLITPKLEVSDAYYSRKLATYNFSIYDMASKEVTCNVWWESEGKRGSCEIATCLMKYNKVVGPKHELIYYSDSCTGQQRNLPFSVMCLYSVINLPINRITHNYFERGHSQMEGDSVHATIESATKRREMFYPGDWITAIKNCKVNKPRYDVNQLTNEEIIDFKDCANQAISNRHKGDDGTIVEWTKIHSFQYKKEEPDKIFYKYNLKDNYRSFTIFRGRFNKQRPLKGYQLTPLYKGKIPISDAKYKDLNSLCRKNVVPNVHHAFYSHLLHNSSSTDILPEPNNSDDSDEE